MSKHTVYRIMAVHSDVQAAYRGPRSLTKRLIRKAGHRALARLFRSTGMTGR